MTFEKGARVNVDGFGLGTVVYVRHGPPSYSDVVAVSVVLDREQGRPGYFGTIFASDVVHPFPLRKEVP